LTNATNPNCHWLPQFQQRLSNRSSLFRPSLASVASVSERAIDNFELERRQANATTNQAIQRAFEDVGVVFLPQEDVQLRGDASAAR
jgi:hypothetical protein